MHYKACSKCKGNYVYLEVNGGYPGGKDREYVYCPHCGNEELSKIISGTFVTEKVDK